MSLLQALVLGVVQGLTEYLPVSSSGHLVLVPRLLDWRVLDDESIARAFDAALHLGTLVGAVVYLRRELATLVAAGVARPASPDGRRAWWTLATAVPAGAAGLVGGDWISRELGGPALVAASLAGFGLVLWWADRRAARRGAGRDATTFGAADAVAVGLAQVLALNPGTSRSGITMTAALARGMSREAAARTAFVVGVPITAAAGAWGVVEIARAGLPDGLGGALVVGIASSAVAGWWAMRLLVRVASARSFAPFVAYRLGLALLVLLVVA
ncbi:MAG: undecaprenyl-diphosphatase [Actinomycetota bacterium]